MTSLGGRHKDEECHGPTVEDEGGRAYQGLKFQKIVRQAFKKIGATKTDRLRLKVNLRRHIFLHKPLTNSDPAQHCGMSDWLPSATPKER